MAKVDLETRRVDVGVRDLLASGSGRARGHGGSSLRAQIGADVHARYRVRREQELGDRFAAEVSIELLLDVDGFTATITGRVDGVIRAEHADGPLTPLRIEEVKSVLAPGVTDLGSAQLQVQAYTLALLRAGHTGTLSPFVVQIGVWDDSERAVPVHFDAADTQARLAALVRTMIEAARDEDRRTRARAQWAEGMQFPHEEIREGQQMLVDAIDDALAEGRPLLAQAPTGTGKTAAALFGAIRYAARRGARVFYATPKSTQHLHVAQTFEALCEASAAAVPEDAKPPLAVSLHARARLCRQGSNVCDRKTCPRLANHSVDGPDIALKLAAKHRYVGGKELADAGRAHNLCPYELGFDLAHVADLVIGDFNYVFDPTIAILSSSQIKTLVVVDEAHNLFDRARAYSSARLMLRELELAEQAIDGADPSALTANTWISAVRAAIHQATADPPRPQDGTGRLIHDGTFELDAFPPQLSSLAQRARALLLRRVSQAPSRQSVGGDDPDPFAEVLRTVIRCAEATDFVTDTLVPYGVAATNRGGAGVGLVCVDPARALLRRHREALGIVAMSATLQPLTYWCDVLGLEALDAVLLEVPSPFSPDQRRVVIAQDVSTTYRDRGSSLPQIAGLIAEVVALRPGPYIVFFPSFSYLGAVAEHLPPLGEVFMQAPRTSLAQRRALLDRFRGAKGPRVLMAVSGGVFGEGIDLPGDELLGALIVGPCLPPIGFETAAMARHFEATRQAGFAYAMLYPGMQRVVQAAGRVIRREEDHGVIVLIGQRFTRPEIVDCLPEDWYRYDPTELVPERPIDALRDFWANR
ncbi:MAG: ATP-dependent DNA helicase [Nannocystaceae bacterium]|nr:ATP-dependent DNA helicase [Nannocystaceae bacterium]